MESNNILQKKIIKGTTLFVVLFIIAISTAEIINFIYLTPFVLPFLLFLDSSETELHSIKFNFIIPFLYGIISDLVTFKAMFVFSIGFVLFSYVIFYLTDNLKIDKKKIYLVYSLIYSAILYELFNIPLWVCIFVLLISFSQWIIVSFITFKLLSGKYSGEA